MSVHQYRDDNGISSPTGLAAFFSSNIADPAYTRYGIFLLRVAIGIDWIAHAFLKT